MDLFAAAGPGSGSVSPHPGRRPFSRGYGAILPSSLTIVLPIALVFSTHPPVSVCGTGPVGLPRGFSRQRGLTGFALRLRPAPQAPWLPRFTGSRPTRHRGDVQNPVQLPSCVAPSVQAPFRGCGNVGPLCIGYAFRPRLSPRLTLGGLASPRKPWVYGGGVTLAALVTHASILTSGRSTAGRPRGFSAGRKAPLPIVIRLSRRFGAMLSPVYCRRMSTRPVSCYALFK